TELGRFADRQAELARRKLQVAALFEAARYNTQGFDRWTDTRHRGHGRLDADVVGAHGPTTDAHAAAAACQAVVRGSPRHPMVRVAACEYPEPLVAPCPKPRLQALAA